MAEPAPKQSATAGATGLEALKAAALAAPPPQKAWGLWLLFLWLAGLFLIASPIGFATLLLGAVVLGEGAYRLRKGDQPPPKVRWDLVPVALLFGLCLFRLANPAAPLMSLPEFLLGTAVLLTSAAWLIGAGLEALRRRLAVLPPLPR